MSNDDETIELNSENIFIDNAWSILAGFEQVILFPHNYENIVSITDTFFPNMFPDIPNMGAFLENMYVQTVYTIITELARELRTKLIQREISYYDFETSYVMLFQKYVECLTNNYQNFNAMILKKTMDKTMRRC